MRTAARFNATIIPVSAVGMADSFNFLLDSKQLLDVPVLGQRAKDFANNVTAARFDVKDEDELFVPPLVTPGLPSRKASTAGQYTDTKQVSRSWSPWTSHAASRLLLPKIRQVPVS